ncbi:MAG: response regulator [Chthoniobacteraceae bacterium]
MSRRIQILIIEDDAVDAELLVMALNRAGVEFDWKRVDTEDAYLDCLRPDLDLIFSDCRMPRFNALRALEMLKERGLKIPFIIMSGSIEESTAAEAIRQGATSCLVKGQKVDLKQVVRQALGEAAP